MDPNRSAHDVDSSFTLDPVLLAQRKAAVELYLKTAEGPNKLTFHPSDPDIIRLAKTENPPAGSAGGAPGSDPTAASGGMGGTTPTPSAGAK